MRKKVIAGNWKMHKTKDEVVQFFNEINNLTVDNNVEAIICAPFLYLDTLVNEIRNPNVKIAAQNVHAVESGAYTGEISAKMLASIGVTHVIIGHSERRQYYNDTDVDVNEKVQAALKHGLIPIVCVGESLEQREAGNTLMHIENQVLIALEEVNVQELENVMIAYEPIWAIGTGKTASSQDANNVCEHIRKVIAENFSETVAEQVVIQYGGSVNGENIEELLLESHIDGALVGGASLQAESFKKLVEAGNKLS